ncbi:nucleoside-diphosphate-sugar epimerase [Bradyrhizobium sp. GM5.1]
MQIIIFGATGMVGQGVLRECLIDARIDRVLVVGRSPTGVRHAKLTEITHGEFTDYSAIEAQLSPASMPASSASASPRSA